jgi:MFS family permease
VADALGNPGLRRIQLSWAVSAIGSWGFFIVLAVYAFEAGGTLGVGIAALVRMVPAGIAAPLAGVLVDRHSRHDVILASLAARAVLLAGIAAAITADAPLAVVLTLSAAVTVVGAAHRPAQAALLPALATTPKQLAAANAVWSAVDNGAFLGGSLLGGALIAAASIQAAFGATAALFALAAIPLALIGRDAVPEHREREASDRVLAEALAGLRHVAAERDLRLVVGFLGVTILIEGAIDVLVVVVALELLDLSGDAVGWLNACWGAGGLVSGVAALGLLARGRLAAGLAAGGVMVAVALVGIAAFVGPVWAGALLGLLGIGYGLVEAAGISLLQRLSSDVVLGRAFAVVESMYWLATGIGAMLAPPLVALLGVRGALVTLGASLLAVVLARSAALGRLEAGVRVPEREFRALRALSLFAPLPIATVENVSRRVHALRLESGRVVIREGDLGDRFYLLAEGRAEVEAGGRPVRECGPGDFFGEIALLRSIPRTATVTTRSTALLYALDRDAFLLAIGAHPRAQTAAHRVAETRLAADAAR